MSYEINYIDGVIQSTTRRHNFILNEVLEDLRTANTNLFAEMQNIDRLLSDHNITQISGLTYGASSSLCKRQEEVNKIFNFFGLCNDYEQFVDETFKSAIQNANDHLSKINIDTVYIDGKENSTYADVEISLATLLNNSDIKDVLQKQYEKLNEIMQKLMRKNLTFEEFLTLIMEQGDFNYDGYDYGVRTNISKILDCVPFIGSIKSLIQLVLGLDPITFRTFPEEERLSNVAYIIPCLNKMETKVTQGVLKIIIGLVKETSKAYGKRCTRDEIEKQVDELANKLNVNITKEDKKSIALGISTFIESITQMAGENDILANIIKIIGNIEGFDKDKMEEELNKAFCG